MAGEVRGGGQCLLSSCCLLAQRTLRYSDWTFLSQTINLQDIMVWSGYVWTDPPSMTAMKYQRQPSVGRALQPGERFSVCREMENSVRSRIYFANLHTSNSYKTQTQPSS